MSLSYQKRLSEIIALERTCAGLRYQALVLAKAITGDASVKSEARAIAREVCGLPARDAKQLKLIR